MVNSFPRVSVVIPTYNRLQLLKETLDSVLRQTIPVHEIIVVDDGSTDATHDLVRSYRPPVVLVTQEHLGLPVARNRGIAQATGEWIAFLDSDDIWTPTKIERQLQYLDQHPSCGFVHTGYYAFWTQGQAVVSVPQHFIAGEYKVEYLLFAQDWICISSALVHKAIRFTFHEWAKNSADILFFVELLRSGIQFGYVNEPLVGYRAHAGSMSAEAKAQSRGGSAQWRWVRETYASDPQEQQRLYQNMLSKAIDWLEMAKRDRNWTSYWEWREWLTEHWPSDLRQPEVLSERIYPTAAYKLKDKMSMPFRLLRKVIKAIRAEQLVQKIKQ
jgi:glycosyltransferase involved in cell wall biosynthesis